MHPTIEGRPLLIVGLGGARAGGAPAEATVRLEVDYAIPAGVRVLDGSGPSAGLVASILRAEAVLLVDETRRGEGPCTPVRLEGDQAAAALERRADEEGSETLALLDRLHWAGCRPRRLSLLGLAPDAGDPGDRETAPASLVDAVAREAARLGYPLTRRHEAPAGYSTSSSAPASSGAAGWLQGGTTPMLRA